MKLNKDMVYFGVMGIMLIVIFFLIKRPSPNEDSKYKHEKDSLTDRLIKQHAVSDSLKIEYDKALTEARKSSEPIIKIKYEKISSNIRVLDANESVVYFTGRISSVRSN